jgi:hypothetical protein
LRETLDLRATLRQYAVQALRFARRVDVIALLKAIPLGVFLTVIVCLFIGSGGSTGGFLHIRHVHIDIAQISLDFWMYWSWTMFMIGTGLAWAILFMME